MLAQNFKTANQLKISDRQHDALIKTLVWFETGKTEHVSMHVMDFDYSYDAGEGIDFGAPTMFNLSSWISSGAACGTVACIGGTAEMLSGADFSNWSSNLGLRRLFSPDGFCNYDKVTVPHAAQALRNYLTTGSPRWSEVMKG